MVSCLLGAPQISSLISAQLHHHYHCLTCQVCVCKNNPHNTRIWLTSITLVWLIILIIFCLRVDSYSKGEII